MDLGDNSVHDVFDVIVECGEEGVDISEYRADDLLFDFGDGEVCELFGGFSSNVDYCDGDILNVGDGCVDVVVDLIDVCRNEGLNFVEESCDIFHEQIHFGVERIFRSSDELQAHSLNFTGQVLNRLVDSERIPTLDTGKASKIENH